MKLNYSSIISCIKVIIKNWKILVTVPKFSYLMVSDRKKIWFLRNKKNQCFGEIFSVHDIIDIDIYSISRCYFSPTVIVTLNLSVTDNDKGHYSWPQTISGHRVDLPCEISRANDSDPVQLRLASHQCSQNGSWAELNTDNCPYVSPVTRILQRFSKVIFLLFFSWVIIRGNY